MVAWIVRFEQLIIFLLILFLYFLFGASWWLWILWIVPDLGMIGYLQNKKIGAFVYNFSHNYLFSLAVLGFGYLAGDGTIFAIGLIFCSHIALDRFLGFGLKYPSDFKDTHIQKL